MGGGGGGGGEIQTLKGQMLINSNNNSTQQTGVPLASMSRVVDPAATFMAVLKFLRMGAITPPVAHRFGLSDSRLNPA
jgi:hypothetical protein